MTRENEMKYTQQTKAHIRNTTERVWYVIYEPVSLISMIYSYNLLVCMVANSSVFVCVCVWLYVYGRRHNGA